MPLNETVTVPAPAPTAAAAPLVTARPTQAAVARPTPAKSWGVRAFLANPLALKPTGSAPGRIAGADVARTAALATSVYGALSMLEPLWAEFVAHADQLPHGAEIETVIKAAISLTAALTHLYHSFAGDSATPATRV
jgi:hypothetical protein